MKSSWFYFAAAGLLLAGAGTGAGQEAPGPNTPRIVKYAELSREIVAQRGKVVVVDFWSIY